MAAECTFIVSGNPFLISVHLSPRDATHDAIIDKGEFGVSLVGEDQVAAMGFAGHFTHHETDMLSSELFEIYPAKKIDAPMIKGCPVNLECKLVQTVSMGDHTAFVGEVVEFAVDPTKKPVAYRRGAYQLGPRIERAHGIGVAVTPRVCKPGSDIAIDGELTCSERAGRDVAVTLESGVGVRVLAGSSRTDDDGFFALRLKIPAEIDMGEYRIVARHETSEGGARLTVS
jgi:flavin reductase (DIM6/NTAB) family NADH-FMN oxidoreductase RutF